MPPSSVLPEPTLWKGDGTVFWLAVTEAVPARQDDSLRGAQVTSKSRAANLAGGMLATETDSGVLVSIGRVQGATRDGDLSPRKAVTPSVSVGRVFLAFVGWCSPLGQVFSPPSIPDWRLLLAWRQRAFLPIFREGVLSRLNSVCRGASRGHLRSSFYWAVERKSQQTEARTSRPHRKSHYMCGVRVRRPPHIRSAEVPALPPNVQSLFRWSGLHFHLCDEGV